MYDHADDLAARRFTQSAWLTKSCSDLAQELPERKRMLTLIQATSHAILVIGLISLAGCTSPYAYMENNAYSEITPQQTPAELAGIWTGTSGPYLMTIKLGADGRGLSCANWQTNKSVNNVKYSGGRLYFPDGMEMAVSVGAGTLMASYDKGGLPPIQLWPDLQLIEASPYCKEKLERQAFQRYRVGAA